MFKDTQVIKIDIATSLTNHYSPALYAMIDDRYTFITKEHIMQKWLVSYIAFFIIHIFYPAEEMRPVLAR